MLGTLRKAPPGSPRGAFGRAGLTAVFLPRAGPDEAVAFAVLVLEQVGEDRRVEARIVELERVVLALLARDFGPGGSDLGAADIDAVGGRFVVGAVVDGDDADAFDLHSQHDDLALELVADL